MFQKGDLEEEVELFRVLKLSEAVSPTSVGDSSSLDERSCSKNLVSVDTQEDKGVGNQNLHWYEPSFSVNCTSLRNDTGSKTCFKILTREEFPKADGINQEQSSSVKSGEIALSNDVVEKSNVGNLKLTINTTGKSLKLKGIIITANENVMVERYDNEAVEINKRSSKCAWELDKLEVEREFDITIDIALCIFEITKYYCTVINVSGHCDLIKNMITGGSQAGCVTLILDSTTSDFETNILKEALLGNNVSFNVENIAIEGLKQGFVASNSKEDYTKEAPNFTSSNHFQNFILENKDVLKGKVLLQGRRS